MNKGCGKRYTIYAGITDISIFEKNVELSFRLLLLVRKGEVN